MIANVVFVRFELYHGVDPIKAKLGKCPDTERFILLKKT